MANSCCFTAEYLVHACTASLWVLNGASSGLTEWLVNHLRLDSKPIKSASDKGTYENVRLQQYLRHVGLQEVEPLCTKGIRKTLQGYKLRKSKTPTGEQSTLFINLLDPSSLNLQSSA